MFLHDIFIVFFSVENGDLPQLCLEAMNLWGSETSKTLVFMDFLQHSYDMV